MHRLDAVLHKPSTAIHRFVHKARQAISSPGRSRGVARAWTESRPGRGVTAESRVRACLLRRWPLVACPGRLRLILQSGLDERACGPCRDRRLFAGCESAQVLQDDQCLPSDDHRQGGYQALEAGVVEAAAQRLDRGLDPIDPPVSALRLPGASGGGIDGQADSRYARTRADRTASGPGAPGGGCGTIAAPRPPVAPGKDTLAALRQIQTVGIEGIPGALGAPALCSRADGVAFGGQGWVRGAGGCL